MTVHTREMPLETRLAPLGVVSKETRTAEVTWSTGARVKKYDWLRGRQYYEELSLGSGVRMGRLQSGAPVLDTHNRYSVRDVIGVVENANLNPATATLRFSDREDVAPIFRDIESGILKNVSVGYAIHKVEEQLPDERSEGLPVYVIREWEPMEISIVPVGADAHAGMRKENRTYPCEFVSLEERSMSNDTAAAATTTDTTADEKAKRAKLFPDQSAAVKEDLREMAKTDAVADTIRRQATEGERQRIADIQAVTRAAKLPESWCAPLIRDGVSIHEARKMVIDAWATESEENSTRSANSVSIIRDEKDTRMQGMEDALCHRLAPSTKLSEVGMEYRSMSTLRMAEECLRHEGVKVNRMSPWEIATRALHTTSDLANIVANVINKRLRSAYEENAGSFRIWARRAPNVQDFKPIQINQLSAMPDLLQVNEHGEFTYGAITDGKEVYQLLTYGRIIGFTRQLLVNDDMRALDRAINGFGSSAARLENRTVYAQITSNPTMGDGVALFHATHGNLTASGTAISDTSLGVGRTMMRLQKGLQLEELNIMPAFLLVPATKEQIAYQWTSPNYQPITAQTTNEFRQGGRTSVEVVVEPILDANSTTAWYLFAANSLIDTVEYTFLEGNEGVFTESRMGFEVDGMEIKARLDFAAKVIDWRGVYKNVGA